MIRIFFIFFISFKIIRVLFIGDVIVCNKNIIKIKYL